jgi:hypothetical protein
VFVTRRTPLLQHPPSSHSRSNSLGRRVEAYPLKPANGAKGDVINCRTGCSDYAVSSLFCCPHSLGAPHDRGLSFFAASLRGFARL